MKFHPLASLFPLLEGEDLEALTESIRANGLREAIVLHPDGSVLDGRNRLRACLKAGVEPRFRTYDGDDALGFVIDLNLNRRQLSISQRAMVAAEIARLRQGARTDLSEISERSQPEAAKLLGVSVDSIGFGRRVLESGDAELIDLVKTDKIAVSLAAKLADDAPEFRQSALAKIKAGERPAIAVKMTRQEGSVDALGDEVDRLPPCIAGDDTEALLEGDADGERKWFGALASGNDEWHTPAPYIARVREVLGTIDLDPASNDIAQRTVKAERYFTKADDGLAHEWHARTVFLNPPYSRDLMPAFVSKLVAEFKAGRVESAILLTNNYTDTAWFHEASVEEPGIQLVKALDPHSWREEALADQAHLVLDPPLLPARRRRASGRLHQIMAAHLQKAPVELALLAQEHRFHRRCASRCAVTKQIKALPQ